MSSMRTLTVSLVLFLLCSCTKTIREERQFGLTEPICDCGKIIKIDTVINGPMGTIRNVTCEKVLK